MLADKSFWSFQTIPLVAGGSFRQSKNGFFLTVSALFMDKGIRG
jgi:hypothetical protein